MNKIHLILTAIQTLQGLNCQLLTVELKTGDRIISPEDLIELELPPGIDTTQGVVISGRGPMWLYGYLIHELHPTAWVACHDPRLGAVVVATHSRQTHIGQIILWEESTQKLSPALMVVGPPDSGKSVFSHALFQALLPQYPDIYLQRANWDGEGNYVLELDEDIDPEIFKAANKGGLTPEFFTYHAQAILQLRRQKKLVIVDVGGMVQPEKMPVLEACTHYLIISSKPEAVPAWHEFCSERGNLKPIAEISSVLDPTEILHKQEPFLQITCGPWIRGNACPVPEVLLKRIQALIHSSAS